MTSQKSDSVGGENRSTAGFVIKLVVTADLLREKQGSRLLGRMGHLGGEKAQTFGNVRHVNLMRNFLICAISLVKTGRSLLLEITPTVSRISENEIQRCAFTVTFLLDRQTVLSQAMCK